MSHAIKIPAKPGPITLSTSSRVVAAVLVALGAAAFFWARAHGHAAQAWGGYLIGAFFTMSLGLFGVLWVSMLSLSKGVWSVSMRRVPEAMSAWLLPGGVLLLLVGLGAHTLYHWADAELVRGDELLRHKAAFLNLPGFFIGIGLSLLLWALFAVLINKNSRQQDADGRVDHSRRNNVLSAIFIVLYALSFSVVSFYLLMSLDAHWFSTIFAVLTFTDLVQTGTAFVAVIVSLLMLRGVLAGFVNENHLHSLAKMVFAATGFWAYIYFCQFMLIWYGNLPEETSYFILRWSNGWVGWLMLLPLVKFAVPFIVMAPRNNKRKPGRVLAVSLLILLAQFVELYVMVAPALGHGEHAAQAHLPLVEGAITLGFLGAFYLVFAWSLGRHNAVPLKDPRLRECLGFRQ